MSGGGKVTGRARAREILALARSRVPYADEYYDLLWYEADPIGGFRLGRNQRLPHVSINSSGFRGPDFDGLEEILFLGDSVTFGVGASGDGARLPVFLEHEIGESVADASVRGYRVFQHYAQIPRLLDTLSRVRLCILWCGYTDLLYWATTGGQLEGAFRFQLKYAEPARTALRRTTRQVFELMTSTAGRLLSCEGQNHTETGTLEGLVHHVSLHIRSIRDLCRARQVEFHVLVQPFLRAKPSDPDLRALSDFLSDSIERKCGLSWYVAAPKFTDSLLAETEGMGVPTSDLQTFMSEADYRDDVHLREEAQRRLAGEISGLVQENLLPRDPQHL